MYVVSLIDNQVTINDWNDRKTIITSADEYYNFFDSEAKRLDKTVDGLEVFFSSSMDYPEDDTNDPKILALVQELKGD
jgi:hypothetical protein